MKLTHAWVVDVATKKARELTHSTEWTVAGAPQWSPDGTRLTINTHPTTLVRDERRGAFIVDVASGRLTPVAGAPAIQSTPVWSPDGTTLAFTTLTQAHAPHADGMMEREQRTTHLTLYDVASGKATDLYDAKQFDEDANGIRWPLQGQLFFTAQDRAWSSLYTVVLGSGTATYKKTRFDGQLVGAVAFSKDAMKTVLALSSSSAPADLYFTRLDAMGERTRLTNANPQLADLKSHVAMMDHAGIDIGVLSCGVGFDQPNLTICRAINDRMAQAEKDFPGRFIGLAHVPALKPDEKIGRAHV